MKNKPTETESRLRQRLSSIRELMAEYSNIRELGQAVLEELQRLFDLSDSQLTVYYDQALALEVTHIRLRNGKLYPSVVRLGADDDPQITDDEDVITPDKAEVIYPLTFRERLVGLLILGPSRRGRPFSDEDLRTQEDLVTPLAVAVDNVMMIRQLSEANQRLFESEKLASIGQLASGIAHEIRNPLSSVKMNLQGLTKMKGLNKRNMRRMQICLDAIDHLDHIIGEMMYLAKRTRLDVKPTTAKRLFELSIELARAEIESRNIKLIVGEMDNLPVINADESRISHALLNLILNAAQATERDGVINLKAEPYGKGLELIVEDNGPGIPHELRRDLFNPFFTTKATGNGLGLSNALKTVQEHGGELDFESEIGKGATFSIRLPEIPPNGVDDPSALRVVPK